MSDGVELTCPHCSYAGRAKAAPPAGAKVRCPRCRGEWAHKETPDFDFVSLETKAPPAVASLKPGEGRLLGFRVKKRPLYRASYPTPWLAWLGGVGATLGLASAYPIVGHDGARFGYALFALLIFGTPLLVMGQVGVYIARQKGRPKGEGFAFGACLGPIGWIVEALLPTLPAPPTTTEGGRS